jgi:hypothetical protein
MGYFTSSRRKRRGERLGRSRAASGPAMPVPDVRLSRAAAPATRGHAGWSFTNMPLHASSAHTAALHADRTAPASKAAEAAEREDDLPPGAKRLTRTGAAVGAVIGGVVGGVAGGLIGGPPGAIVGALGGAALGGLIGNVITGTTPTLSKSNDTYDDSGGESRKRIRFDASIPVTHSVKDYAMVNWVKGFMKNGSGTYFKAKMYGSWVDSNYSSFKVDSVDADPIYGSDSSGRWNYHETVDGFYTTDNPGPALDTEHGAEYALKFQMGLYKLADVPTTTSGTISSTPLAMVPWDYSVKVDNSGKFTHPSI